MCFSSAFLTNWPFEIKKQFEEMVFRLVIRTKCKACTKALNVGCEWQLLHHSRWSALALFTLQNRPYGWQGHIDYFINHKLATSVEVTDFLKYSKASVKSNLPELLIKSGETDVIS